MGKRTALFLLLSLTITSFAGALSLDTLREEGQPSNPAKVLIVKEEFDHNRNKIADNLETMMSNRTSLDIFIALDSPPTDAYIEWLKEHVNKIHLIWGSESLLYGVLADVPINQTNLIASNSRVKLLDIIHPKKLLVYRTVRQIRVRPVVWSSYGYDGNSSSGRVAVVDSGIDDSHTDFNGKIFNWTDCAKFLSDCTTVGVQLHDNLGHGTSAASIIVGTGQQAGIASSPGFVNLTAYGEFNGSDGSKDYRHWFPYSSISTDLSFNASLNWTGPAGQWQILNISNNSLPDIGSNASNIEPLKVTSLTIPSGSEDYAFVRIKANSTDGVESNDNVYIVSFTTRLRNLSDSFNLLTGTATGTQVISVKVVEDDDQTNSWDWLEGINWIGNHTTSDNIRIASMSLGGAWSPTEAQIFESLIKKGS